MSIDQLFSGIFTLITIFFSFQGSYLLNAKIKQIKQLTKNQTVKNALDSVEDTVADVVVYLKTTTVSQIKEASADGKLTKEEITEIVGQAKRRILAIISEDSLLILNDVIDDVDAWLENKIEKHVDLTK